MAMKSPVCHKALHHWWVSRQGLSVPCPPLWLPRSPAALLIYRCSAALGAINHHNVPNHDLYRSRDGSVGVGACDKLLTDGVWASQPEFRLLGAAWRCPGM